MLADIKCLPECAPGDRPNIFYEVKERTSVEEDFCSIISDVKGNAIKAKRILPITKYVFYTLQLFLY